MIKTWFFGNWWISMKFEKGYWRWPVGKYGVKCETVGKEKDQALAFDNALTALSRLAVALTTEN
jgi:hypothetical protein